MGNPANCPGNISLEVATDRPTGIPADPMSMGGLVMSPGRGRPAKLELEPWNCDKPERSTGRLEDEREDDDGEESNTCCAESKRKP